MMEFLAGLGIGLWVGAITTVIVVMWLKGQGYEMTRYKEVK